jgi:proteasome lid subunit RPN8/RPN11
MAAGQTKDIKAALTRSAYRELIQVCRRSFPIEACGLLAGSVTSPCGSSGIAAADTLYPITNTAVRTGNAFRFHPSDWVNTYFDIQKNQQSLVGFYHSHPHSEAVPSRRDAAGWLSGMKAFYWIVSFADPERPEIRAFIPIRSGGELMFAQVSVEIA